MCSAVCSFSRSSRSPRCCRSASTCPRSRRRPRPHVDPAALRRHALAQHRPVPRRPHQGGGRARQPAAHLLHRRGQRRRVEDDRRRPHLEADLRRPADRLDRRGRRRAVRSQHRLRRQRRRPAAAGPLGRRRHLQVDRRRQDVDAPRPARRAADPASWSSTRRIPIGSSSPRSAIPTARTRSAASSARPTAARRSRTCSTRTRTPAARTSTSIRRTPTSSTPTLWEQRQGPWENGAWDGTSGGLFKSTDGGTTWTPLTQGLPDGHHRRRARHRADATPGGSTPRSKRDGGGTGLYRSDDAGETLDAAATHGSAADQPDQRGRAARPPGGPGHVIVTDVVSYKSTDGGKTFTPFKGAPGGDDYQNIWWNPNNPDIMLLVVDQGAVVTLNGGADVELLVQPADRALYHVMTDNAFPYRVCGGQQDSGSACVASRGNDGQITFRDWHPVGVEEYGYAAPDPLDPDICLRRQGDPLRPPHRSGVRTSDRSAVGEAARRRARPIATVRTQPVRLLAGRSADAVLRQQRAVEDDRRRHQLEADQPGPHARDVGRAGERRHLRVARRGARRAAPSARR